MIFLTIFSRCFAQKFAKSAAVKRVEGAGLFSDGVVGILQTALDELPANFLRHYFACKGGPSAYKYIMII